MSERTSRRAESSVTTIVSGGEAVKNHERIGDIADFEAQIVGLQAIVDEKKAESRNAEAWGSDDQIITIDTDGNRSDYEGYKEWRTDHDAGLDDLSNFDENGNLKGELDSGDLTSLSLMQLVGEARNMNDLGDRAGKQEVFDIIQDKLAERAVNEDWSEKELLFQLDRFEGLIGTVGDTESNPSPQPEATASPVPAAEMPETVEPAVEGETSNDEVLNDELNPGEHSVEYAVEDGESIEEYENRLNVNRKLVPIIGDSIVISDPLEYTANNTEDEQAPVEDAVESRDILASEAVLAGKQTWKDALRNPGGYLAVKMQDWQKASEGRRLANQTIEQDHTDVEKNQNRKRLIGAVVGVVVAFAAYKLGSDILGDQSVFADPGNVPNIGGGEAVPAPDVAPAPAAPIVEGRGQHWDVVPNYSEAARTVTDGEGLNQTFLELNIPESEWTSLVQKVGPQLAEQGWTYRMPNGSWGISHTGIFPDSVLQLIQNNR